MDCSVSVSLLDCKSLACLALVPKEAILWMTDPNR